MRLIWLARTRVCALAAGVAATLMGVGALALAQPPERRGEVPPPRVLPPHTRFPAPWVGLVGAEDRAGAYDPTRVRLAGDTAAVWLRYQFPRDVPPILGDAARPVRAIEARFQVRCAARRVRDTGDLIALSAGNDTVGTHAGPAAGGWRRFDDADFHGRVLTRVCECLRCARGPR